MIQQESLVKVADNSGAKMAQCLRVLGGTRKRYARVGDKIIVAIKSATPTSSVKKSTVCKAVVVRTCKEMGRKDGSYIKFEDNAVVLIDNNNEPRGSSVFGPIAREVRDRRFMKISSLADQVL